MIGVAEGFAIILSVIGVGYLLSRLKVIGSEEQRLVLNKVAFYAATPALIFTVVSQATPKDLFSPVIVASTLSAVLIACVFVLISRIFFPTDRASTVMGAASCGYVNSNNIGLPVGIYVLGNAAYVPPLLLVQMVFLTPIILALISSSSRVTTAIRQALLSPIVFAAIAGLAVSLSGLNAPDALTEPLKILGGASIPMILLSFGASLHAASPLSDPTFRAAAVTATALKVVGMPAVAYAVGMLMGFDSEQLYAVCILAALPTAQNIYNYAATYRRGMVVARDTVLLSTFLALPAMLLIAFLFGR